jgi:hypothetical protein
LVRAVNKLKKKIGSGPCTAEELRRGIDDIAWRLCCLFGDRQVKDWERHNLNQAEDLICRLGWRVSDAINAGWRGWPVETAKPLDIFD